MKICISVNLNPTGTNDMLFDYDACQNSAVSSFSPFTKWFQGGAVEGGATSVIKLHQILQ